jgi:hypothetical protein
MYSTSINRVRLAAVDIIPAYNAFNMSKNSPFPALFASRNRVGELFATRIHTPAYSSRVQTQRPANTARRQDWVPRLLSLPQKAVHAHVNPKMLQWDQRSPARLAR